MQKKILLIIVVAASALCLWVINRSETSPTTAAKQTAEHKSASHVPPELISQAESQVAEEGTLLRDTVGSTEGTHVPAQVSVSLYVSNALMPGPLRSTSLDENGGFDLGKWPAANYIVVAQTTIGQKRGSVRIATRDFAEASYYDSPNPSAIDLRLEACMLVHGQILDSSERPISGASVAIQHRYSTARIAEVMTGPEGKFSICRTAGDNLTAHADGYADIHISAWSGDKHYQLILQPRVAIAGRVVDSKGVALSGISVSIHDVFPSALYMQSGSDGEFAFDALPAGEFEIRATRSEEVRASYDEDISTRNGKDLWWGIEMQDPEKDEDEDEDWEEEEDDEEEDEVRREPSLITGQIHFQGRPVPRAEVTTFPINGFCGLSLAKTISDRNGRYQIRTKESGPVTVRVKHTKGAASVVTTESDTSPIVIDFELIAAASLSGRITDRNGDPLPRTSLCLEGSSRKRSTTDVNGRFSVKNLEPGTYQINIGCRGKVSTKTREVSITAGQNLELALSTQLLADQAIRGNVVRDDNGPLHGIICIGYDEACTVLGPGGSFEFGGLSGSGPYDISVSAIDGAIATRDKVPLDTYTTILVGKAGAVEGIAPKGCSVSGGIPSSSTGRSFHLGPRGPGPTHATLRCDDRADRTLTFTIVAGETISLGNIRP